MKSYQLLLTKMVVSVGAAGSGSGPLGMQNTTEMTHQENTHLLGPLRLLSSRTHHCSFDLGQGSGNHEAAATVARPVPVPYLPLTHRKLSRCWCLLQKSLPSSWSCLSYFYLTKLRQAYLIASKQYLHPEPAEECGKCSFSFLTSAIQQGPLDVPCTIELSVMREMFSLCTAQYSSLYPDVATEYLKCGQYN